MTDVTWLENVSPSYCSSTQDPELVAEFNFFTTIGAGLAAPLGTPQRQLTNQLVTVTLATGRSFIVDPSLAIASGDGEATVTEMGELIGRCQYGSSSSAVHTLSSNATGSYTTSALCWCDYRHLCVVVVLF
jgi:hypothetical protein